MEHKAGEHFGQDACPSQGTHTVTHYGQPRDTTLRLDCEKNTEYPEETSSTLREHENSTQRKVGPPRYPDPGGTENAAPASGTQRTTTVTFAIRPGTGQPAPSPGRQPENMPGQQHASSPVTSPPDSGPSRASSLPASASSPTLTDVFGLPTPPITGERFSLGSGRSRSPSPLTLIQAVSNKPFATKPVVLWTKHDVADWLESLNLAEHKDAFMDNEIEGTHLPNLQKEDLIDLGVTRVGHRMNIERALKLLLDR